MKNLVLLFTAMLLNTSGVFAAGTNEDKVAIRNAYNFNNSFIFVENGITFSVFPDGEFDFYIDNLVNGSRNGITFNSGFDYSPYAQYDDYGAVIQVENIPIFYDYYGRVNQIGDVDINYRNGRVRRLGGMNVFYNNRGFYDYHTGFINIYNRNYVYRPFHNWFARPALNLCLVYNRPYRRYYAPVRYTYYNPYRNNFRRAYVNVGKQHSYNKVRNERARIYRNDERVTVRDNSYRTNSSVAKRDNGLRTNRSIASSNTARSSRSTTVNRTSTARRDNVGRSNQGNTANKREVTRSQGTKSSVQRGNSAGQRNTQSRTVTKREVSSTPGSTTVKRSTTTYKKPVARKTDTRSAQGRTQRASATTKTQRSSTVRSTSKTPTRQQSTVSGNSKSRSVAKAPSRVSKSVNSRSATTRSNRRN